MRIVVGISGASGVVLGARLLEALADDHEVHLVVSKAALRTLEYEASKGIALPCKRRYEPTDLAAPIASSSFRIDGMAIVPCSLKTLGTIAAGIGDDLLSRAAENALKMRRRLVLMVRETPLSLIAIENMRAVTLAGAIVLPPAAAYYHRPRTLSDMNDFFVGKVLDALDIENNLYRHWEGPEEE